MCKQELGFLYTIHLFKMEVFWRENRLLVIRDSLSLSLCLSLSLFVCLSFSQTVMCFSSIRMSSVICADWSKVAIPTFFSCLKDCCIDYLIQHQFVLSGFLKHGKSFQSEGTNLIKASAPVMGQETMWLLSCEMATHTVTLKTTRNTGTAVYMPGHCSGSDSGPLGWPAARPAHSGPMKVSGQPLGLGCHRGTTFSLEF